FLAARKNCLIDPSDDASCTAKRSFTYERYLAVGDGDVASVSAEAWKTRNTPTGTLLGFVLWQETGDPSTNAQVFVFNDPQPGHAWGSLDDLVAGCQSTFGNNGIV